MGTDVDACVEFDGVWVGFGGEPVLRGVSLRVGSGESVVVIGGSGAGKSVILRLTLGLLRPARGSIRLWGHEIGRAREFDLVPLRRRVGMLFQGGALFDSLTVYENIAFPLREHQKRPEAEVEAIVKRKLEEVGLPGIEERMPAELSGGMRKRVALARAIAMDPELVLYDEPTTGLDPMNAARISDLIATLHERLGVTSIIVTHDMACADRVGKRFAFLSGGKVLAEGNPEEVRSSSNDELRAFFGTGTGAGRR